MSRHVARRLRALVVATLLVCGGIVIAAPPAYAHGVGGVQPRNYETKLLRVEPRVAGVELAVVDLGDNLQLRNTSRNDVLVLGYDGEPYLRVGPRGVFENMRSPATYLNRSRIPTSKPPKSADSSAAPIWHQVSSATTATWHDHRVHFMGSSDPPEVQRDPSVRHVIERWTVELRTDWSYRARIRVSCSGCPHRPRGRTSRSRSAVAAGVFVLTRTRIWRAVFAVGTRALGGERSRARGRALGRDDRVDRVQAGRERLFARRGRAQPVRARVDVAARCRLRDAARSSSRRSSCSSPGVSPTCRRSVTRRFRPRSRTWSRGSS